MKTRPHIYARMTVAVCDADRRSIHWPTQVNSRINSVHHFAEVYEANAEATDAALRTTTQRDQKAAPV